MPSFSPTQIATWSNKPKDGGFAQRDLPLRLADKSARQGRSQMKPAWRLQTVVAGAALIGALATLAAAYGASSGPSNGLAAPERFSSIAAAEQRSAALFTELGKVLTHPRCANCHPAGDRPRQGDFGRLHQSPVERGADGFGLPAMRCPICHQRDNRTCPHAGKPPMAPRAA